MKKWYEELFENYAETYDKECFTQGAIGEVDFIEKEINFDKTKCILDVGCGTGRHSIESTKRGYNVTGIDYSEGQLKGARNKAKDAGFDIEFIQMDARELKFDKKFDLAIMLCEGAFPLMETDEMNFQILQKISAVVADNGKFIMTTLSALFPIFNSLKEILNNPGNQSSTSDIAFDIITFREKSKLTFKDDDGVEKEIDTDERFYTPAEMTWLLKTAGFKKVDIFGSKLGAFSREDKLTTEDFEMLIVAEK